MASLREQLEVCISELTYLLDLEGPTEAEFQAWFERHPAVWPILGYQRCIPHPSLELPGAAPMIPDFLVKRADGLWEIFELKRPDTAVLKNPERRTAFYSGMNEYISQCHEYAERCSDSVVFKALFEAYGVSMNGGPASTIVAGRTAGLDRLKVHSILKRLTPKVSHLTYDDVLEALNQHYVANLSGSTDGSGFSLYSSLGLGEKGESKDEFLFDLGASLDRNRISLIRRSNQIVTFMVIDDQGLRSLQDINLDNHCAKDAFVCAIHVTHTASAALVLFEINGTYVGQHEIANGSLVLDHPMPIVLAADLEGKNGARVFEGGHLFRDPAFSIAQRSLVREYMFEQLWPQAETPRHAMRFEIGQFMYSEGHPILDAASPRTTNLVQRNDDARPRLANWVSSGAEYTKPLNEQAGALGGQHAT